ncbi:MAG: ThuA domain-containing protein [Tannerella sp.]|jgi:type 1 glutamine amidotransferase|nr:ThuA domain-containing protein [Tannerella sp.]
MNMKIFYHFFVLIMVLSVGHVFLACHAEKKVKVLIITGGHDYDEARFDQLLAKLPITYDKVEHPDAFGMLTPENIKPYRTVLLYDMPDRITESAKKDFIAMLENGTGLVVLHHAVCSYPDWTEYLRIVGGRYAHTEWMKDTIPQPASTYKHDVEMMVKVGDLEHPVTEGIYDFQIIDETYAHMEILQTVHPLLFTDEPSSSSLLGWVNRYGNARIFTLTLGHDHQAWENPSFIQILSQALRWTAEKSGR